MRLIALALSALLVFAGAAPAGAAMWSQQAEGYDGTHVSFTTESSAVVDYQVDGTTMLERVEMQSQSNAESSGAVEAGTSLSAVTDIEGSAVSTSSTTEASATVEAESGATLEAHDNGHGIMVVAAGSESQYVQANVSSSTEAEANSDGTVSVTTDDGTEGTFIVVGEGEATVNDDGDVVAKLESDSKLVFRSYPEGKDDGDQNEEQLIADGEAAGEVYVMAEEGGETTVDTVTYAQETTIEAEQSAEDEVTMTIDRASEEGKVVITSVSESAISSTEDLSVTVDGEAAAEASSYSELHGAIGSDNSRYMVRQASSASAAAEVLVAINHFSEREVTMSEGSPDDGSDGTDGDDGTDGEDGSDGNDGDDGNTGAMPGFGALLAIAAIGATLYLVQRRG